MGQAKRIRQLLNEDGIIVVPGAYDALTAKIVEKAGFKAVLTGGYSIAASRLGEPDIGYLTMTEMTDTVRAIAGAVDLPLIADGDTGYGNALSAMRTVREYERAGAAAILFEDQVWPKRCGHMAGKSVVPAREHVKKIEAAVSAKENPDLVIIARTDALAVNGPDDAIKRGISYLEAGADALFIEAPRSVEEMGQIARAFPGVPLVANMVENGVTPLLTSAELEDMGYKIVFWPCTAVYTVVKAYSEALAVLAQNGTTAGYQERMADFGTFNKFIGLDEYRRLEKKFKLP